MSLYKNSSIDLSVAIPAFNEEGNITPLIDEISRHISDLQLPPSYEIIIVDDCSSDNTLAEVENLMATYSNLRVYTHQTRGGKSAALRNAFNAARGQWVATLDGDGQNDPADLAKYWNTVKNGPSDTIYAGVRKMRNDGFVKKWTSKIANKIRIALLKDGTRDTGCGFKILPKTLLPKLPYFDNMHRFFPALARMNGYDVIELSINDRPREHGQSKYGFFDRASVALLDLIGVFWLSRRKYSAGSVKQIQKKELNSTMDQAG